MRTLAIALLISINALQAQGDLRVLGFTLPEGKSKVTIPIEIHNNLIVMPVVINGQLPMKFILDTGVRTAILTEKSYSDILGLPYSRQLTIMGPGEQHVITAYIANNVSIYIPPDVKGEGHSLLVLEKDYLELRNFLGTEVHGVLGYELFSRFIVLINYHDRYIELHDPASYKPKRKYQKLGISIEDTKPFLKTNVNVAKKKELKLLIDTGASHSLMLDPTSDNEILVPERNIATVIGRALGGEITGKIGRAQSMDLGKYKFENIIANFPDPNSYMDTLKSSIVARNGSIGGELLSRFTVVFDYSGNKIYLHKNASFKKDFQLNLSGITVKAKGARLKTFEIIEVRQKSVAERADIRKGDMLVGLNGNGMESFDLNEINAIFNSKPGKKIALIIDRGGEKIRKTITLEQEI